MTGFCKRGEGSIGREATAETDWEPKPTAPCDVESIISTLIKASNLKKGDEKKP